MGTFIGHLLPGIGFMLIGLWHLFNTIRNYAQAPWDFETRPWFLTKFKGKLKYLELYAIIFGSSLSIASELFIGPERHQPLADDWSIPPEHLNNFEHSSISLFFLIYATVALCVDVYQILVPYGLLHVLAAFAFSQELLLFHLHSADHMGLEGHYHWLLQLLVMTSLCTTLLEIARQQSFLVASIRSMSILFQGVWFIQMAFVLWIPFFTPKGCKRNWGDGHFVVRCQDEASTMRGKALANLQFNWHFAGLVLFTVICYIAATMYYRTQVRYQFIHEGEEASGNPKDIELGTGHKRSRDDGSHSSMEDLPPLNLER